MKKIVFVMMFLMTSMLVYSQSKTYKVKQGETLESVAYKHGIPVETLLQANPQALDNFHIGMKLLIPAANYGNLPAEETVVVKGDRPDSRQGRGCGTFDLGFQYVMIGGDAKVLFKDFNWGMNTEMGYRYYLHHNMFVEGLLGYRMYSMWMIDKSTITVHNITLPIHLGATIDVTDKFALRPFWGPRVDFPVKSKIENGSFSESAGVDIGVSLEFGLDLKFNNWGIRTRYGLGVGEYKNINYLSIGVIAGF